MRDKALFALLCLTGIRIAALVSLRIKHIDLVEKSVSQNPREVATKFGKSIDTFFARGFEEAEAALGAWITYLDEVALYGPDDPLFPATAIAAQANTGFKATGFERRQWKSTEPARKIVNGAFAKAACQITARTLSGTCSRAKPQAMRHRLRSSSPIRRTLGIRTF